MSPKVKRDERLVDGVEHAVLGRADRGRTAEVSDLDVQERRADERLDHRVDRGRAAGR